MPFQPINFASIEPQGNPGLRDFVSNLAQGYKVGQLPFQLARQADQERLANAMNRLLLQEQPQKFGEESQGRQLHNAFQTLLNQEQPQKFDEESQKRQLHNAFQSLLNQEQPGKFGSEQATASSGRALNQAHIDQLRQEMSLPFGGKTPPGSIGQAIWLSKIKQQYGDQSPEYKDAKTAFESDLEKSHSLVDYRGVLTDTMDKRSASALTKLALEKADIEEGYRPGTSRTEKLSTEERQKLGGQFDLKMQKEVSDMDSRKRSLFAKNIDNTLANIKVDDLTQYAGAKGSLAKLSEQAKAPFGKESQSYRNFQKSLSGAQLLAKQIRQFYGDSIQPTMQAHIESMINPSTWANNPELAKQSFDTVKNILQQETETYRGALKSTKTFESTSANAPKERHYNRSTGRLE